MNIQENNKLIAEFMQSIEDGLYLDGLYFHKGRYYDTNMEFHESWEWLMSVVKKIKNIAVKDENIEVFYEVANHIPDRHETYKSVVEFINQYNKTK